MQMLAATTPLGLLLVALIAVVIPFLVDLITKRFATSATKAAILLLLSLINGFVLEWLNAVNENVTFNWATALNTLILSFLISVGSFYGFTKPANLNGADGPLATNGGIGKIDPVKMALEPQPASDGGLGTSKK